jgi:alginate O-acetyltransferase complex protein AlgI
MEVDVGKTVTSRQAPHRRYVPRARAAPGNVPGGSRDWGLYPGEPETCRRRLVPFARTLVCLGLLCVLFKRYHIEGRAFFTLVNLALGALPIHYLAHYRWKKPLFLAVSITGLCWVFGTLTTAVILGLSAVLLSICISAAFMDRPGRAPLRDGRGAGLRARPGRLLAGARERLADPCQHVYVPSNDLFI